MNAIGYIRVSTDEQAQGGVSLEAQRASIRAYADQRGFTLLDVLADPGVSGGTPLAARPAGELIGRAGANAIIAYKLDRLFRDAIDCLDHSRQWDRAGIALHLVDLGGQPVDTSSAMGRFFLTVMAGAAELERNQIRERTRLALQRMKTQGRRVGSVPYGYRVAEDGVHLTEDPSETVLVDRVLALHDTGASLRHIANTITQEGFSNRANRPFRHPTIGNIIRAARGE